LSALILIPLAVRGGALRAAFERPAALAGAALLQAMIPLLLLTIGQQHVQAGLAAILVASQPVWAAAITGVLDRSLRVRELAGVLTGLAGVILLFAHGTGAGATSVWGAAALLGAAFCYGSGAVYIQRVIPQIPARATAAAAMTISALVLLPFAVIVQTRMPSITTITWLTVLAVAATGLPLVLFYALIQEIGPVRANLAGYLAPGFALTYSLALFGEVPGPTAIAGLALILAGSCIAAGGQTSATPKLAGNEGDGRTSCPPRTPR
jgi:drug/metabolite transporter (DMT)-like permease